MSLKQYKKVKYLGKGSYGAAILVEEKSTSLKFVMKEVVVGHLSNDQKASAHQEATVLHQMNHSNITKYIESFMEGEKLYIVMEYADGGDLTGLIKKRKDTVKPFSESDVMQLFVQICLALRHVHSHNILHRDLKSQNVFLTSKGIIKLGDFGIARVLDSTNAQAQTQIGTPYYLSPEICDNKAYGRESDIWSLGVILYELLALELPFQAGSLPQLMIKISTAEPPLQKIRQYSALTLDLVLGMLAKLPAARPNIQQVIHHDVMRTHINQLWSHTVLLSNPQAKDVDRVLDPEEADRYIERMREELKEQELRKLRESKEAQQRLERERKREADREELRRVMEGNKALTKAMGGVDIEIKVSEAPRRPVEQFSPDVGVARRQDLPRVQPVPQVADQREVYEQREREAAREKLRRFKEEIPQDALGPRMSRQSSFQSEPQQMVRYNSQRSMQQAPQVGEYESAARREFLANRAAAQMNKERVEAYERGAAGAMGMRPPSNKVILPELDEYPSNADRVRASREQERQREEATKAQALQEAYEAQRQEKKRIQQQQQQQQQRAVESSIESVSRRGSAFLDVQQGEERDQKDEQAYLDDLAQVAKEQRAEVRRIKELRGGPVAFEVKLEDDIAAAVAPVRKGSVRRDAESSEEDVYARGVRAVLGALKSRDDAGEEGNDGEEKAIVRRSWGAPVPGEFIARQPGLSRDVQGVLFEDTEAQDNGRLEETVDLFQGRVLGGGDILESEEEARGRAREAIRKYKSRGAN